jgi:hypothetical protein
MAMIMYDRKLFNAVRAGASTLQISKMQIIKMVAALLIGVWYVQNRCDRAAVSKKCSGPQLKASAELIKISRRKHRVRNLAEQCIFLSSLRHGGMGN